MGKVYKILIDARSMRKGQNGPTRYAENMLKNLALTDHINQYTIIVNNGYKGFIEKENFEVISTSIEPYRIREHWAIKRLIKGRNFDLFHCLQYLPPMGVKCPIVLTIYDVMHMRKDFWHGSFVRKAMGVYARILARYFLKKAATIITISEVSAKKIATTFDYSLDKIYPIYLGVDRSYRERNQSIDFSNALKCRNLPGPYLLSVSNMRPYKNVDTLLYAYVDLVNSGSKNYSLVLAGKASDADIGSKIELVKVLGLTDKVFFFKGLNDEELKQLLGGASLFIFPSREEGFGLPLLEAMASGVPCIASDIEVFREVCGEGALFFDPNSSVALKDTILKLLLSDQLRSELVGKGRQRADSFLWEQTARQTLAVYNKVLETKLLS